MPERIRVGDLSLAYDLSGPEDAPVVCLNHCFCADHRYWDPHLEAVAGFRVLRYDMRGHGGSDGSPGPWTLDAMADDVVHLLDALAIGRVHYCGVSLGGQVAQTVALRHPARLRSLTLVNTTCEYTDEQVVAWRDRAATALAEGMGALAPALLARWFTAEAAARALPGYRYMAERLAVFPAASFAAGSEAMCGLDTTHRLPEVAVPAQVIATTDDPGAPRKVSERMASLIPGCALHWLDPARHLASLEHPERFNRLLRDFLLACPDERS